MPFPLAHPAAALLVRRWIPRGMSFQAILVGTVCPDLSYILPRFTPTDESHHWNGVFSFSLPAGLAVLILLRLTGLLVLDRLPAWLKAPLVPLCRPKPAPLLGICLSLVAGAFLHLAWDSFTHTDGWAVQRISLLRDPLFTALGRRVRLCQILWYGSTFAGVYMLGASYWRWRAAQAGLVAAVPWRPLVVAAAAGLPLALIHHLSADRTGLYLTLALLPFFAGGFLLWAAKSTKQTGENRPPE